MARHDGYIERQLRRGRTQYEQMHVVGVDTCLIEAVGDDSARGLPAPAARCRRPRDYRLDKHGPRRQWPRTRDPRLGDLHVGRPDRRLRSLDGLLGERATRPRRCSAWHPRPPRVSPTSCEMVLRRTRRTRHSISVTSPTIRRFGYWKLACIMQGVFALQRRGGRRRPGQRLGIPEPYFLMLAQSAKMTLEVN